MVKKRDRRRHVRTEHPGREDTPIRFELFSNDQFEHHAKNLALNHKISPSHKGRNLMPRVQENARILLEAYRAVSRQVREKRSITPASEWLLDNFHIIKAQLSDINTDLPEKFYLQLPKLAQGEFAGYPRVYSIAWALVAHTDSHFSPELLTVFVNAYQRIEPLTLGELWAIPITLKIILVENLRRLAVRIMRSQNARRLADAYVDEIERSMARYGNAQTPEAARALPDEALRQAFVVQILQRLHDPHPGASMTLSFINDWISEQGLSFDEIVHNEHGAQIADNVTVRNIITSMRAISAFEWAPFVENVSLVDQCLKNHEGYAGMDFLTRDRYRHAIEDLAKYSPHSELDITRKVVTKVGYLKEHDNNERITDPGYYLIGSGRYEFEKELDYQPALYHFLLRTFVRNAGVSYIGSILLWTALLAVILIDAALDNGLSNYAAVLIGLLGLIPASDIAIGLLNKIIVSNLPPRHIPRLDFKEGIPAHLSTFVVVPTLFTTVSGVREQVQALEIHYLSNPGEHVRYALLSDWADADRETVESDELLLSTARTGIAALNLKYGREIFFVFHRRRLWNASEGKWMGWERKRGKLHEFNRMLRGATDTTFLPAHGEPAKAPTGFAYVLTLDADTKLPLDIVPQLVGVAAHPLNRPVFDDRCQCVVEGYAILQPRVTPTLPKRHERSLFHQLFAGASGTDAYSSTVSELYQDLFGLGTYSGKGLYHIDSFEAALANRIPENTLLSHDLFEGVFARCALVSDVEFFDEFPSHIDVSASREHRWTRGDWQLLPWILGFRAKGLPVVGRWKMIDNLRRSLSAPTALFALVAAWTIPDAPIFELMAYSLISLSFPGILAVLDTALSAPTRGVSWRTHWRAISEKIGWGVSNSLVTLALLPQSAELKLHAIGVTLIRLFITRRQLLDWVTAMQAKVNVTYAERKFFRPLAFSTAVVGVIGALVMMFNPQNMLIASPFLLLWWVAPLLAFWLSLPPKLDYAETIQAEDKILLRLVGRRIWHFFTTFVTEEDHFLPPDNFQEDPFPIVAHRSSPTNFGLYLLSVVAAHDFGWLGLNDCVGRLEATLNTLMALPRFRGHFYNWYETRDLRVLEPAYISTVDSGNLAGHLLTLAQSLKDMMASPFILNTALTGLNDTYRLLKTTLDNLGDDKRTHTITLAAVQDKLAGFEPLLQARPADAASWHGLWEQLKIKSETLVDMTKTYCAERGDARTGELLGWTRAFKDNIESHYRDIQAFLPWLHHAGDLAVLRNHHKNDSLWLHLTALLELDSKLDQLPADYAHALDELESNGAAPAAGIDRNRIGQSFRRSHDHVEQMLQRIRALITQLEELFRHMDFTFLYDAGTNLFSIGYRVADGKLDSSYYDLLASEARLTSLLAIAKRDIPSSHWYHLGRRVTRAVNGAVLLSWSGSMFEYLMPSLVTFTPRYSLIDQTCRLTIKRQIQYGTERNTPWGISESAFSSRDIHFTYQYSPFGVPGLGMKRGLQEDLVISPYSTALAAMYLPHAAVDNFKRLEEEGGLGTYGYYEALDYTPARLSQGQTVAVVKCYMAHHQGMSLVAIGNTLHNGIMRHRFHQFPQIKATELLLQERVPQGAETTDVNFEELAEIKDVIQFPVRKAPSPVASVPSTLLLSNGHYTVMMTAAGSGYSQWKNAAVTRWREDVTRDAWGSFIFLRDTATGKVWSAGYQPTVQVPEHYDVQFSEDRLRIRRTDRQIDSLLEVVVSPEDDAEIRRLSLTNNSSREREIEITTYSEIVLTPFKADVAHPVFSNLFVETEYHNPIKGLVAHRRSRTAHDAPMWAMHLLTGARAYGELQYETDRARFIGRGRTIRQPIAVMDGRPLTNTVGRVLDPVFSLRVKLKIPPGLTENLVFATIAASSRETLFAVAEKYHNLDIFERVTGLAWTHAQILLHHLRITIEEAQMFQEIANRLLYSDPYLRPAGQVMAANRLNVTDLWRFGISGDRPILLARVSSPEQRRIVEQMLKAHEYWRLKGLAVDLVLLNEKETSYIDDLQALLNGLVQDNQLLSSYRPSSSQGAVYVMRADQLPPEHLILLQTAARAVINANKGTLSEQLLRQTRANASYVRHRVGLKDAVDGRDQFPTPSLKFFNGLGGFTEDGREYVIILEKNQWTPSPWTNVIANSRFGCIVTESGGGFTWSGNSRENQLTPWTNDPVSDPSGEALYLRDDDSLELWSPTPLPIRAPQLKYQISHGQGYSRFQHSRGGLYSELLQFVSPHDPVKLSWLKIKNNSGRLRRLTVAVYAEWVLGFTRTITAPYIITELDPETKSLFAHNPWDKEFGSRQAFIDMRGRQTFWTADRGDFIGRNGSLGAPSGLTEAKFPPARIGAGLDPCAVLGQTLELQPDQEAEIVVILGQGADRAEGLELIKRYRKIEPAAVFDQVVKHWDSYLSRIEVKTPDQALDFLVNRWLIYQTLSCRMWARAAFYQVGGAFGFRDQLQDSLALSLIEPHLTRQQILQAAGRQFPEGDVQHWWHPPTGRGVRTQFSDDRLWLPYVTAHYLKVTGDTALLDEELAFIQGPLLTPGQEDAYFEPELANLKASVYEHCARAIEISLATGRHGLPLIGCGDWNDGMNRVGMEGQGESVWLAWFLIATLKEFAGIAEARGETERASTWRHHILKLNAALESEAWDGAWYRRAFFDDGSPLGSASDFECRIDAIAQSWSVIAGSSKKDRARQAMESVREYLVRYGDDLILLFTPPFDHTEKNPGYIKGYPPGVRENGGQYTHAAVWTLIAFAVMGEGNQAYDLLRMLNPVNRTANRTGVHAYKVEPYVLAADIYSEPPHTRRGGWTWYTGAAGWYYRACVEWILGFRIHGDRIHGDRLILNPCIPANWNGYSIAYRYKDTYYDIRIENPNGVERGISQITMDGAVQEARDSIPLVNDNNRHQVEVTLG